MAIVVRVSSVDHHPSLGVALSSDRLWLRRVRSVTTRRPWKGSYWDSVQGYSVRRDGGIKSMSFVVASRL